NILPLQLGHMLNGQFFMQLQQFRLGMEGRLLQQRLREINAVIRLSEGNRAAEDTFMATAVGGCGMAEMQGGRLKRAVSHVTEEADQPQSHAYAHVTQTGDFATGTIDQNKRSEEHTSELQ